MDGSGGMAALLVFIVYQLIVRFANDTMGVGIHVRVLNLNRRPAISPAVERSVTGCKIKF